MYFCLIPQGKKGGWDGMFSAAEVQAEVKKTVHLSSLQRLPSKDLSAQSKPEHQNEQNVQSTELI